MLEVVKDDTLVLGKNQISKTFLDKDSLGTNCVIGMLIFNWCSIIKRKLIPTHTHAVALATITMLTQFTHINLILVQLSLTYLSRSHFEGVDVTP